MMATVHFCQEYSQICIEAVPDKGPGSKSTKLYFMATVQADYLTGRLPYEKTSILDETHFKLGYLTKT